MKKIVCYAFSAALALSLCACANSDETINSSDSESDTPFVEVSDPFDEKNSSGIESGGTDSQYEEDDGYNFLREWGGGFSEDYIDCEKHRDSSTSCDNVQVKADGESFDKESTVIYRGGEVEISFTATVHTAASDHSTGYRVFLGGTPQIISLNDSDPSPMVVMEGKDGDTKECSIRFTPRFTKENLAKKAELALTLVWMDNPLYLPFGTVAHFDPPQGMAFNHIPFKLEGDCETVELVSGKSFENFVGRDSEVQKYMNAERLSSLGDEHHSLAFELCSTTIEKPVIQDGKADITLLLYGGKPAVTVPYKVYFYVNHEPVKLDGCDYITVEWKEGFVAKYSTTLDNLKADDIVYAIAIADSAVDMPEGYYSDGVMKTVTGRLLAAE